jgi:hypothetical protein
VNPIVQALQQQGGGGGGGEDEDGMPDLKYLCIYIYTHMRIDR